MSLKSVRLVDIRVVFIQCSKERGR